MANPGVDPRLALDHPRGFSNFLWLAFKHLGLPDPTPAQYEIADYLQHGPRRTVIEAFRGLGKTLILVIYACWRLYNNPDVKIVVISASKPLADDFTGFCLRLITEMEVLQHLVPEDGQRSSMMKFDVAGATASHAPSLKSVGISGQIAGSRADIVIFDDVEIPNNSDTQGKREKLAEAIKEADAILRPEGRVVFLGTPQTEESIYSILPERGYKVRIWPARIPTARQVESYGDRLAPSIAERWSEADVGKPTDPGRFSEQELMERELSYGRSGFQLQFMLDTSLSDADRYPLKINDIVVWGGDMDRGPESLVWSGAKESAIEALPLVGFRGDRWHCPLTLSKDFVPYQGTVLAIDPSGRGEDETGFAALKQLNGWFHLKMAGGLRGGYTPENLERLAGAARAVKANRILVESNFGDGMFSELLKPYLRRIWPCTIEEVRSSTQKERRIIDTLEPVLNQHRLVVDPKVIEADYAGCQELPPDKRLSYQLFYQLSRITKEKGSLRHDDRLDALAMAVAYFRRSAAMDVDAMVEERKKADVERMLQEYDDYIDGINGTPQGDNWIRGAASR